MDIQEIRNRIAALNTKLDELSRKAETGAEWAEICRIEADELMPLMRERSQWIEDNSQFGVGA